MMFDDETMEVVNFRKVTERGPPAYRTTHRRICGVDERMAAAYST